MAERGFIYCGRGGVGEKLPPKKDPHVHSCVGNNHNSINSATA